MTWWRNLPSFEKNGYSQCGEEGVLHHIFGNIEPISKFCVEFGAADGKRQSNTKRFRELGWNSLLLDIAPAAPGVIKCAITAENINFAFKQHGVPRNLDLLSIDIDGNDYWVWKALKWHARVVVIECNPQWPPGVAKTIKYNPKHAFDKTNYYGASPLALKKLGETKGMALVYCNGLNCIFVHRRELPKTFNYNLQYAPKSGWPGDSKNRPWVEV